MHRAAGMFEACESKCLLTKCNQLCSTSGIIYYSHHGGKKWHISLKRIDQFKQTIFLGSKVFEHWLFSCKSPDPPSMNPIPLQDLWTSLSTTLGALPCSLISRGVKSLKKIGHPCVEKDCNHERFKRHFWSLKKSLRASTGFLLLLG